MFSRAAKSVVKNLGQRKCYVTDENIKVRVIGAAEEIGQTLSQYAKTGSKINSLSISNSIPKPNLLMISAEKSQTLKASQAPKVQDPRTESFPQKSQQKNNSIVSYFANRELDLEKTVTELRDKEIKLSAGNGLRKQAAETSAQQKITDFPLSEEKVTGQIWALNGIAAVQHDPSASQWRQLGQTRSEGLPYTPLNTQPRNAELTISRTPKVTSEEVHVLARTLFAKESTSEPPNRSQNDDYFPQGDDYIDDIGGNEYSKPSEPKKPSRSRVRKLTTDVDEDQDNFSPTFIACSKAPSNLIMRPHNIANSEGNILSKNVSEGDTLESLKALVEKVAEFKRRMFGSNKEGKMEANDGKKSEFPEANEPGNSRGDQIISTL